MRIECPKCHFSREINERSIPSNTSYVICPKCKEQFPFKASASLYKNEVEQKSAASTESPKTSPIIPSSKTISTTVSAQSKQDKRGDRMLFHGTGGEILKIHILNMLLTIITIGVYHFWGKVKIRNYLYSQTEFLEERFSYHGTGKELFLGWLKFMGLLIIGTGVLVGLPFLHPTLKLLTPFLNAILVLVIIIFAMLGAMRYRLSRTSWRGIRFSFRGKFKELFDTYGVGSILTAVTIGIYYPFFHIKLRSYWANNSYYGATPFKYEGKGQDLMRSTILALFLSIITFGIYSIWYMAKLERYDWQHTSFPGIRFKSAITGGKLFSQKLLNILLIIFALGLAYPWVIVRNLKFKFSNIIIEGDLEFDKIRQDAQKTGAIGEGAADIFNIDSGII